MEIGVLILAGGEGKRFGYIDKSQLLCGEKTFIEILREEFYPEKIYISAKKVPAKKLENIEYLIERESIYSPLYGIIKGFESTNIELFFVIGCDMPFIKKEHLYKILEKIEDFDGIILKKDKNLYPLGAIYTRKLLPKMKEMAEKKQYRLRDIFDERCRKITFDELKIDIKDYANINNIEDYKNYINPRKEE